LNVSGFSPLSLLVKSREHTVILVDLKTSTDFRKSMNGVVSRNIVKCKSRRAGITTVDEWLILMETKQSAWWRKQQKRAKMTWWSRVGLGNLSQADVERNEL
jgi:hypothetical protein